MEIYIVLSERDEYLEGGVGGGEGREASRGASVEGEGGWDGGRRG